jgi:UDP-N-acetylmuramate dehydrogenase
MNAGADGRYISEIVESVLVLRDEKVCLLSHKECEYAYKKSIFMENNDVILGANLRLESCTAEQIAERERYYLKRRAHLPKGKSMGCVFKNPQGISAGALIEGSGLKGLRIGGAKISNEHANFIINDKSATAKDIRTLITIAKNAVWAQYKIKLEEEIRYL